MQRITDCYGVGDALMIIENIPMYRCPHCHERYFTVQTLLEIERIEACRSEVAKARPVAVGRTATTPALPGETCASCGSKGVKVQHVTRCYGLGNSLTVIENIPLCRCPHCHERYFSAQTLLEIERIKNHPQELAVDRLLPIAEFPS